MTTVVPADRLLEVCESVRRHADGRVAQNSVAAGLSMNEFGRVEAAKKVMHSNQFKIILSDAQKHITSLKSVLDSAVSLLPLLSSLSEEEILASSTHLDSVDASAEFAAVAQSLAKISQGLVTIGEGSDPLLLQQRIEALKMSLASLPPSAKIPRHGSPGEAVARVAPHHMAKEELDAWAASLFF